MFLSPVITYLITGHTGMALVMILLTIFSAHAYKFAKELYEGTKPYFEDYPE
jgi:hypothetical protein